jgi:hypothetical protein
MCIMQYEALRMVDLSQVTIYDGHDSHIFRDLIAALSSMEHLVTLMLPHIGLAEADMPLHNGFQCLESLTVAGPPKGLIEFSWHTLPPKCDARSRDRKHPDIRRRRMTGLHFLAVLSARFIAAGD